MRRLVLLAIGVAIGLLVGGALLARALQGPDPANLNGEPTGYFVVAIDAFDAPFDEPFTVQGHDRTTFQEVDGWDFGDRSSYSCAWVEFFDGGGGSFYSGGEQMFEVTYRLVSDYPNNVLIDDRFGAEVENPDPKSSELQQVSADCWEGAVFRDTVDPKTGVVTHHFDWDGSDHFPHGTAIAFYRDRNGDGYVSRAEEFTRIDYSSEGHGTCGTLYWTPGDEPGEAWLWWDEDGAGDMMMHGDGLCGGGPQEPIALVQAKPRNVVEGIGYCVLDAMDGDLCSGITEPPPPPPPTCVISPKTGRCQPPKS